MTAGRLNSGDCLRCGTPLIMGADELPISGPYQCCSKCTDFLERQRYDVLKKVQNKTLKNKITINSNQAVRPLDAMGHAVPGAVDFGEAKV